MLPPGSHIFQDPRPGRIVAVARDKAFPVSEPGSRVLLAPKSNRNARAMILTRRSLGGDPSLASRLGAGRKHQNSPIYSRLKEVSLGEPIEFSIGGRADLNK
jgi:hypothetical protein